jgi:AraC-like DNA-binding protein
MGMEGQQRVGPLVAVPRLLHQFGQNPAEILSASGFAANVLENPENLLSLAGAGRLILACVAATKCSHFGLLIGQQAGTKNLGLVGQLMRNAPTLGSAIYDLCVNQPRYVRGSVVYLSIREKIAIWGYGIHLPNVPGIEQVNDLVVAMAFNMILELSGPAPEQIRIARPTPDDVRPYIQLFGQMPIFDAEQSALVFPSKFLNRPVKSANPQVRMELEKAVAKYWLVTQPSIKDQVVRIVSARSVSGQPTLANVAKELGIHPRTLNRKLEIDGTNFRSLLALGRLEISRQLLRNTRMKITDIAQALGYSETSAFTRAFQNSAGKSPLAWRKQS